MKAKGLKFKILKTICLVMLVVLSTSCFSLLGTTIYGSLKGMQNPPAEVETETPDNSTELFKSEMITFTNEQKEILRYVCSDRTVENYTYSAEMQQHQSIKVEKSSSQVQYLNQPTINKESKNVTSQTETKEQKTFKYSDSLDLGILYSSVRDYYNSCKSLTRTSSTRIQALEKLHTQTVSIEDYSNFVINDAEGMVVFTTLLNEGITTFASQTVVLTSDTDFEGEELLYKGFSGTFNFRGATLYNVSYGQTEVKSFILYDVVPDENGDGEREILFEFLSSAGVVYSPFILCQGYIYNLRICNINVSATAASSINVTLETGDLVAKGDGKIYYVNFPNASEGAAMIAYRKNGQTYFALDTQDNINDICNDLGVDSFNAWSVYNTNSTQLAVNSGVQVSGFTAYGYTFIANCMVENLTVTTSGTTSNISVSGIMATESSASNCLIQNVVVGACSGFYRFGPISSNIPYKGSQSIIEQCVVNNVTNNATEAEDYKSEGAAFVIPEITNCFNESAASYSGLLVSKNKGIKDVAADGSTYNFWYQDSGTDYNLKFNNGKPYLRLFINWCRIYYEVNTDTDTAMDTTQTAIFPCVFVPDTSADNCLQQKYIDLMSSDYINSNSFKIYDEDIETKNTITGYRFVSWYRGTENVYDSESGSYVDAEQWLETSGYSISVLNINWNDVYICIKYVPDYDPESYYLDFDLPSNIPDDVVILTDDDGDTTNGIILVDYNDSITISCTSKVSPKGVELKIVINGHTVTVVVPEAYYVYYEDVTVAELELFQGRTSMGKIYGGGTVNIDLTDQSTYKITLNIVLKEYTVTPGEPVEE